ncbi:uncharacterized protein TrAFT101_007773 [Trichoderma asperellum]|uniref:uncharacterized protein n=1 Tax=Trichoderma asperellum TaxID=101201 RepID=UPI0033247143|nr:hypothetical protein TrAFT101_007773 [Trichoderma asperellum]
MAWGVSTLLVPGPDTRAEWSLEPTGSLAAKLSLCGIGYALPKAPRIVPSLGGFYAKLLPIGFGPRGRGVALLGSVSTEEVHPFRFPPLRQKKKRRKNNKKMIKNKLNKEAKDWFRDGC